MNLISERSFNESIVKILPLRIGGFNGSYDGSSARGDKEGDVQSAR